MTYMFILKCALKVVEEIILYYDARSKKTSSWNICFESLINVTAFYPNLFCCIMINAVRKSDIVFNDSYRLNKRDFEICVPLSNLKILAFGPPGL